MIMPRSENKLDENEHNNTFNHIFVVYKILCIKIRIQFVLNFRKKYIKYVRGGSGKGKYPHKKSHLMPLQ